MDLWRPAPGPGAPGSMLGRGTMIKPAPRWRVGVHAAALLAVLWSCSSDGPGSESAPPATEPRGGGSENAGQPAPAPDLSDSRLSASKAPTDDAARRYLEMSPMGARAAGLAPPSLDDATGVPGKLVGG